VREDTLVLEHAPQLPVPGSGAKAAQGLPKVKASKYAFLSCLS
jgi:hypothetical protein